MPRVSRGLLIPSDASLAHFRMIPSQFIGIQLRAISVEIAQRDRPMGLFYKMPS